MAQSSGRWLPGARRRWERHSSNRRLAARRVFFEALESRLLLTFVLDPTFDADGLVTTRFEGGETARAVSTQTVLGVPKIVVAGESFTTPNFINEFAVVRYELDGSLDESFGDKGLATAGFDSSFGAWDLAIQLDGKIVAVGAMNHGVGGSDDFAVVRFGEDGSLDSSFGNGGLVTTDVLEVGLGDDEARGVALQGDGKILVAGTSFRSVEQFAIVRYNADGGIDAGFGEGGVVSFGLGGFGNTLRDIGVQNDGRIVVVGGASDDSGGSILAMRLLSNGQLDDTFGVGGVARTEISESFQVLEELRIQPDGKIVAVGTATVGLQRDVALVRYNTNGELDLSFGNNGLVTTDFTGRDEFGQGVALLANGKIVVAAQGPIGPGKDFHLASFDTDGSLDGSFGPAGARITTDFHGGIDTLYGLVIQPQNGKIIAAGQSASKFALSRYTDERLSDIAVSKIADPDLAVPGDSLTYTVTVTNNGPFEATSVNSTDQLPAGVAFSSSESDSSCRLGESDDVVICEFGSVAVGSANRESKNIVVNIEPSAVGNLTNSVIASGEETDPNRSNNMAMVTSALTPVSDLSVSMSQAPVPALRSDVTYEMIIRNHGPATAVGVKYLNTLPAGATFAGGISSLGTLEHSNGTVTVDLGTLDVDASAVVTLRVIPFALGTITNHGVVSGVIDPVADNNSATVRTEVVELPPPPADLMLSIHGSTDVVAPEDRLTYFLTVKNNGPNDATGVAIRDTLPDHVVYDRARSDPRCHESANVVTCGLGDIRAGEISSEVAIVIDAPPYDAIYFDFGELRMVNSAIVSANEPDSDLLNDRVNLVNTVSPKQNYDFVKIFDSGDPQLSPYAEVEPLVGSLGLSLNNRGEVAFSIRDKNSREQGIFVGNGGPLTRIADSVNSFPAIGDDRWILGAPQINDFGMVAFSVTRDSVRCETGQGFEPFAGIYAGNGGPLVAVREISGSGVELAAHTDVNNNGTIAFKEVTRDVECNITGHRLVAVNSQRQLIKTIADATDPHFDALGKRIAINETDTVAFNASLSGVDGAIGIFSGSGDAPREFTAIADTAGTNGNFQGLDTDILVVAAPAINDRGSVAFSGTKDGRQGIFVGSGGPVSVVADITNPFDHFGDAHPGINNDGTVAFRSVAKGLLPITDPNRSSNGIFTGPDPKADKVIAGPDLLFDLPALEFQYRGAINDFGQIAFATFQQGRFVIARADPVDRDTDTILDRVEGKAPNGGDGDDSGIQDRLEPHVTSVPNQVDGRYVTIVSDLGTVLSDVRAMAPPPNPPTGVELPFGLLDFTITGVEPPGSTLDVQLVVHSDTPVNTYYKFEAPNTWTELPPVSVEATDIGGIVRNKLTLRITDGSIHDCDRAANGEICDPGAPAYINEQPTVTIQEVLPNPRLQGVPEVSIKFSEEIHGFDLADLILKHDGLEVSLSETATLSTTDSVTWTLGSLTSLTDQPGTYQISLIRADSDIRDSAGANLAQGATVSWTDIRQAGDSNLDGQFDQFDVILVLQGGKYRRAEVATWRDGDWDGDGRFDQFDVIEALQTLGYRRGPYIVRAHGLTSAGRTVLADNNPAIVDEIFSELALPKIWPIHRRKL